MDLPQGLGCPGDEFGDLTSSSLPLLFWIGDLWPGQDEQATESFVNHGVCLWAECACVCVMCCVCVCVRVCVCGVCVVCVCVVVCVCMCVCVER